MWAESLIRLLLCTTTAFEGCIPIPSVQLDCNLDDSNAVSAEEDESTVATFLVDSGASVHCCTRAELFTCFTEHNPKKRVRVASGTFVPVIAIGDVVVRVKDQHGKIQSITLKGVYYVPQLKVDLISTKLLWNQHWLC